MPKFIKITSQTGVSTWVNPDHIIQIQRKHDDETKSFVWQQGGQYVDTYYAEESVEQILEMINGQ